MKKNQNKIFDCTIIGGGIVGAGIFREQALHELDVLLLEQGDFSSQTSQGSSKMLHGGIRYLENFDFFLVFEALKEKNLWLKLTPHLTQEKAFYLPVYKESKWPLFFLRIGLFIYDCLSLFQNSSYRIYSKSKTLKNLPGIKTEGLKGCGVYYDGIVDDAKLALECIYDGLKYKGAQAYNYKKVISVTKNASGLFEVCYQDTISKEIITTLSKTVVSATGPFTDQLMEKLNKKWDPIILPSKGTHLWIKEDALNLQSPMVLQTKDQRIIFVIPQNQAILVGTTEIPLTENEEIFNIQATDEEIDYLLNALNEYFPQGHINKSHLISSFCAVRPLVKSSKGSSQTSRKHQIYEVEENFFAIAGGKYTTFRKMAFDINKKIFKALKVKHQKDLSLSPLKTSSLIASAMERTPTKEEIINIIQKEHVKTKEDLIKRRLSLPALSHLQNEELESFIKDLSLESIRKSSE